MKTAFLVDADFFLRRLRRLRGELKANEVVQTLMWICSEHLRLFQRDQTQLYRILVYDCAPLSKNAHYPVSGKAINWSKTPTYAWRTAIHAALRSQRKVALRLGRLNDHAAWVIRPDKLKALLAGKLQVSDLTDADFDFDVQQKGVDMRIGLDIASISSKRLADQMVLIAGDSDFVPAAKAARREGVDFVLDSMGADTPSDLREHIDGLQSVLTATTPLPFLTPSPNATGSPSK